MDAIKKFEQQQIAQLTEGKNLPDFRPGDTLKVGVKIIEGKNERLQYFQGLCIAKSGDALNSSFTVRKISNGEGVERKFPLYSPRIDSIEVVRKGIVRRAKLYYMRELRGKAARIQEKQEFHNAKEKSAPAKAAKQDKAPAKKTETKASEQKQD